jgi:hypothetical protein
MDTSLTLPSSGVFYSWVQLDARASSSGLSQVRVHVDAKSQPRELRKKDGKGLVTARDIEAVERSIEACIERAAQAFRPESDSPLKNVAPSRVWILYTSYDPLDAYWFP